MDAGSIVANSHAQAAEGSGLSMENFVGHGSVGQGMRTFANIASDNQKSLQESYRAGLSRSAAAHEGVEGR